MKNIKIILFKYFKGDSIVAGSSMPYDNEKADIELAEKIVNVNKHDSITEHVVFQFKIEGISRLCLQELARHRMASPTVKSTRYTLKPMLDDFDSLFNEKKCWTEPELLETVEKWFVNPYNYPNLLGNNEFEAHEIGKIIKQLENEYVINIKNSVISLLHERDIIRDANKSGLKLPERMNDYSKYNICEALRTNVFWTINLRSLRNFLNLRDSDKAHMEIRHVAKGIKALIKNTEYKNFV